MMPESVEIKFIDVEGLSGMIGWEHLIVVDIRDSESYRKEHIPGALALNGDREIKDFLANTPKTKTIVCCCYRGISSQKAAAYLKTQGFEDVYSLTGGFEGWKAKNPA